MITIGGKAVKFAMSGDGQAVQESWPAGEGPRARVLYQCAWGDRFAVANALRGGRSGGAGSIGFIVPHQYPPSPNLFCLGLGEFFGIKPRVGDDGFLAYQEVVIPAEYGVPRFDFEGTESRDASGKPFTTTTCKVSAEVFTPPGGAFYYAAGTFSGKPVAESSIGLIRPRTEIRMKRHWMPYIPLDEIETYIGTVNDGEVTIGNRTYPRGCLLFAGADTTDEVDSLSARSDEVEYVILGQSDNEWNEILDPEGLYVLINDRADGSGQGPFLYSDFYAQLP